MHPINTSLNLVDTRDGRAEIDIHNNMSSASMSLTNWSNRLPKDMFLLG